ncbi:MAG TPA: aminopeptidase [Candidatus Nanoarchaeia archaeon]|nr:aminopeptidase [Candidatus Nanoarchaeia archaeon]
MKINLDKSSKIILKECMGLKRNESCLIVTDSKLKKIGEALFRESLRLAKKSKLVFTNIPKSHGSEPQKNIADEMLKYDVCLLATIKSLSHTRARENASKKGARIASMPGITEGMAKRTLNLNLNDIRKRNDMLISKLKSKNIIKITTNKGTDLKFFIKGRKWVSDDGIYTKKGAFGNLPSGEIFIAPLENKTNGILVCDASVAGLGIIDKNIRMEIKDGFIKNIRGGKTAAKFQKLLKTRLHGNVAELGIGTNHKAKITGEVLEDEKVMGTFHVAFGNNLHFGGKVDVPFHVDFVMKNPRVFADGKRFL